MTACGSKTAESGRPLLATMNTLRLSIVIGSLFSTSHTTDMWRLVFQLSFLKRKREIALSFARMLTTDTWHKSSEEYTMVNKLISICHLLNM